MRETDVCIVINYSYSRNTTLFTLRPNERQQSLCETVKEYTWENWQVLFRLLFKYSFSNQPCALFRGNETQMLALVDVS